MDADVLVAGAGFLGVSAALKLARKGYDVKVIDENTHQEFTPGIIDVFRDRVEESKLKLDLENFFEDTPISFSRERINDFEPEENRVETDSGTYEYRYLVLALGSEPRTYNLDVENIETCYSLAGAKKIRSQLSRGSKATVIGSGYVGAEIAGEIAEKGVEVEVIEKKTRPTPNSHVKTSRKVLNHFNDKDITFKAGRTVDKINYSSVELEDGEKVYSDVFIWAGGIKASSLAREHFESDYRGVKTQKGYQLENHDNIYAGGDCADTSQLKTANNAIKQGKQIAANIDSRRQKEINQEKTPLLISLGDTAILEYGDLNIKSGLMRTLKDWVRKKYFWKLGWRKKRLQIKQKLGF
ncbi:MAG: NAD(P)/FAD-dependent oxidoreductase [Candidatus Nanohaloarchaea archaeon]